ncbi:thiamine pyrophosphate-dependent dehydrogenase E1 component subunit alpha [Jonesia quinghaiensis]|uniref:thiamine pyrophosphate-dependent dehydrogenase E1 component subunit alpha n=1 Tax=Jonesia quinghaiensis TaxID=262806 RepID=UPI00040C399B
MTDLLHHPLVEFTAEHAPLQFINERGERVENQQNAQFVRYLEHLNVDDLKNFYRDMMVVRRFDIEATALQRQGELALYAPLLGQEAAQVGSGQALAASDMVFPSYREHGVAHTRGMDMAKILQLFRGVDHGGWDSFEHNFHLYTLVIGSHALHAVGYAMGIQQDARMTAQRDAAAQHDAATQHSDAQAGAHFGDADAGEQGTTQPQADASSPDSASAAFRGDTSQDASHTGQAPQEAVMVYFGDGATSQGDVSEALGFAAVNNAPVVFFCQNNQWAISVPNSLQFKAPLYLRGSGFGVPGVRVDGNDVLAVHAATRWALEHARHGNGPVFIEAVTYRMGAHTTSDDPTKYRSREEEAHWRAKDPIDRIRLALEAEGAWSETDDAALSAELEGFGEYLRGYVRSLGAPEKSSMFEHVYATENVLVSEDKAWFAEYEASFVDAQGEAQ